MTFSGWTLLDITAEDKLLRESFERVCSDVLPLQRLLQIEEQGPATDEYKQISETLGIEELFIQADSSIAELRTKALIVALTFGQHAFPLTFLTSLIDQHSKFCSAVNMPNFFRYVLSTAYLAGASGKCLELATKYVKERKQFGVAVGAFQAVQHQLANSYLYWEGVMAGVKGAATADLSRRKMALGQASSMLLIAAREAPLACERAIQLHGGMGFTWEAGLHIWLLRCRELIGGLSSYRSEVERGILAGGA